MQTKMEDHKVGVIHASQACVPVINELLCYIQNKMDNMPTDELCKIILEFCTGGQIESSKTILYKACEGTEDEMMKQSNKHLNNESKIRRLLAMTRISISFTHIRYHQITKFLHCCDHRGKRFAEEFTVHQQVAVDECMIPFHGRMSFK